MPRQARKQSTTDYYHVMIRGINKEFIFNDDKYKEKFIELMKLEEQAGLIKIGAWCIMDNHAHMLFKASLIDMSKAIKIICLKYAAYYNKASNRTGPVFGDRYRSENVENDIYMLQVVRYIHNNPIKANIVHNIADYHWSSYKYYIKQSDIVLKEQKDFILSFYNNKINNFIDYHKKIDNNEYIEIKEDQEKYRLEVGQKFVKEFIKNKGIIDFKELTLNPDWIDEIVKILIQNCNLTLRQIAKITGISVSIIYKKSIG